MVTYEALGRDSKAEHRNTPLLSQANHNDAGIEKVRLH